MRAAVFAATLLMLPMLAPGAMAASVLDSGSASGGGWIAWRVESDGAPMLVRVEGVNAPGVVGGGLMAFGWSGALLSTTTVLFQSGDEGVAAHGHAGMTDARYALFAPLPGRADIVIEFTITAPAGWYTLLTWVNGDFENWRWHFEAGSSSWVRSTTSGARTILAPFGDADASGYGARLDAFGYGARADAQRRLDLAVASGLYVATASTGADDARMMGPGGAVACQRAGPLILDPLVGPCTFTRAGGGAYAATLTGAGGGTGPAGEAWLVGADAVLPS